MESWSNGIERFFPLFNIPSPKGCFCLKRINLFYLSLSVENDLLQRHKAGSKTILK